MPTVGETPKQLTGAASNSGEVGPWQRCKIAWVFSSFFLVNRSLKGEKKEGKCLVWKGETKRDEGDVMCLMV
jgi:hypothetical protein